MPDAREAIIVAQNSSTATATLLSGWARGIDSTEEIAEAFIYLHSVIFDNALQAAAGAVVADNFSGPGAASVTYGQGFENPAPNLRDWDGPANVPAPPAPPVTAFAAPALVNTNDGEKALAFLSGYTGNFPFLVDLKSKASRGLSEKQVASVLKCAARER